jgi:hypothetical protein
MPPNSHPEFVERTRHNIWGRDSANYLGNSARCLPIGLCVLHKIEGLAHYIARVKEERASSSDADSTVWYFFAEVRDQEVDGSNPFAPTTSSFTKDLRVCAANLLYWICSATYAHLPQLCRKGMKIVEAVQPAIPIFLQQPSLPLVCSRTLPPFSESLRLQRR